MNTLTKRLYKRRDSLRQLLYTKFPQAASSKSICLGMTLMVRDEIDIIERNLAHHFSRGVDFIVVTDHMSTDGTREFLLKFEANSNGKLHVILKDDPAFYQALWVNEMGDLAFNKYGADYVIHCDADEFWCAHNGSIKDELLRYPQVEVFTIRSWQCFLDLDALQNQFPNNIGFIRTDRKLSKGDRKKFPRKFDDTFNKVILKKNNPMPLVQRGNHNVENRFAYKNLISNNLIVFHFPMRSVEQIARSFKNYASSTRHEAKETKIKDYHDAAVNQDGFKKIADKYGSTEKEAAQCIAFGYITPHPSEILKKHIPSLYE